MMLDQILHSGLIFGTLVFAGGIQAADAKFTQEELRKAKLVAADVDPDPYQCGRGTPAEFITNRYYTLRSARWAVRSGRERGNIAYEDAVRQLAEFFCQARQGLEWEETPQKVCLPCLDSPPMLDGVLSPGEWEKALTFPGEYPIGSRVSEPKFQNSRWHIGRSGDFLYVGVRFSDKDIQIFSGTSFDEPDPVYQGDSLEFFIRPDVKSPYYREYLVNPHGKRWILRHKASPHGQWDMLESSADSEMEARTSITPDGFCIEAKILLKTPESEQWSFMPVRSNRDKNGLVRYSTPVPLLYDAHNIYGYVETGRSVGR